MVREVDFGTQIDMNTAGGGTGYDDNGYDYDRYDEAGLDEDDYPA
jgi:hypothetical protein